MNNTISQEQLERLSQFFRDMQPAVDLVNSWPAWKQRELPPVPHAPDFPPVELESP